MEEMRVGRLISSTLIREGAGVKLHRYIGSDRSNNFEPILLFDYFDSNEPLDYIAGFPSHPHRGFETITYLLHGMITHEDNQGRIGTIGAGDVQWMSAGKGIIHSEMPASTSGRLQGLQLWLNLPATQKMDEPRYQEIACNLLPFEHQDSGVVIKVIAGATDGGTTSPIIAIATKPLFFDISLPKGTSFKQHIPKGYQTLLFVLSGQVSIADQIIQPKELVALTPGKIVSLSCTLESQCLLISAEKLNEPITRYGPFVMNTQEEVMQALDDFRQGKF